MRVRDKIARSFTTLMALLLLTIFILIYFFAQKYTHNEFYVRLNQRATIAAQFFLEEDELNASIYNEIRLEHMHTLPEEQEAIIKVDSQKRILLEPIDYTLPGTFYEQCFNNGFARYNNNRIFYYGILKSHHNEDYLVIIRAKDIYGRSKLDNLKNTLIFTYLLGVFLTYLLGRYYAKQAMSPIVKMTGRVNKITATNLHMRLETTEKKDELSQLAETFNNMLDRLETSFDLQSNFISNASHEFKNPLTAILGEIEITLNRERSAEEYKNSLIKIEKDAGRLDLLVSGLLKLAQTEFDDKGLVIEPIRIDELIIGVKKDFDRIHPENKIMFDFSELPGTPEDLVVQGNRSLLGVAFNNILDNAVKFSMNKDVTVKISVKDATVAVLITDKGVGIPPDELKNIFEPFFRASNVRGVMGFGVGLPLTYRIIKLHGGQLKITSEVEKGTQVNVLLPHENQHIIVRK